MASDCGNGGCEFVENAVNAVAEYNCAVMSPNVGEEGEVERSLRSSSLAALRRWRVSAGLCGCESGE